MTRAADPAKAMRANGLILGSSSLLKPGMIRQILKQNNCIIDYIHSNMVSVVQSVSQYM